MDFNYEKFTGFSFPFNKVSLKKDKSKKKKPKSQSTGSLWSDDQNGTVKT